ncbi:MAG: hypothetical protein AAGH40_00410 [Verrucomicrobiota bacterium]
MKSYSKLYLPKPRRSQFAYTILSIFFALSSLQAESSDLNENSPFLPPGYGEETENAPQKPVPVTNGPISREIEFRGLIQLGGVYKFSLFSKNEQKGYWIRQNQTVEGISVQSFDLDSMTVVVGKNGRAERLTISSATDSPLPVSVAKAPQSNQPAQRNATTANNNQNTPTRKQVVPRRRVILPKK